MATLQEITDRMREAVGSDSGLGSSVKFDFGDEGKVFIDGGAVNNEDAPALCGATEPGWRGQWQGQHHDPDLSLPG
jgi:putative sterol carrier protein